MRAACESDSRVAAGQNQAVDVAVTLNYEHLNHQDQRPRLLTFRKLTSFNDQCILEPLSKQYQHQTVTMKACLWIWTDTNRPVETEVLQGCCWCSLSPALTAPSSGEEQEVVLWLLLEPQESHLTDRDQWHHWFSCNHKDVWIQLICGV